MNMPIEINGVNYYTTQEACEYLGVSKPTLDKYVSRKRLKRYKRGIARTQYYKETELASLLNMREIEEE